MDHARRTDAAALVFGAVLLLVGGYFLLEKTFGFQLPEINWDQVWPVAIIALGLAVVYRAWSGRGTPSQRS